MLGLSTDTDRHDECIATVTTTITEAQQAVAHLEHGTSIVHLIVLEMPLVGRVESVVAAMSLCSLPLVSVHTWPVRCTTGATLFGVHFTINARSGQHRSDVSVPFIPTDGSSLSTEHNSFERGPVARTVAHTVPLVLFYLPHE